MPVIKSTEAPRYAAFSMTDIEQEAVALLEGAKRRAAAILEHARVEATREREKGYREGVGEGRTQGHTEGFEQGRQEGRDQAYQEYTQQLTELAAALDGVLRGFNGDREALASRASGEITRLALAIADRVCKRAAEFEPAVAAANTTAALRLVMRSHDIKLHVNPDDYEQIKRLLPTVGRKWPALTHVELIDDADVSRGGCRVFTEGGLVDADLQTQLDRVAADLVPDKAEGTRHKAV